MYSLSIVEQYKLGVFITENLYTKQTRSLKSSMVVLNFFVKKKNGFLCLVQDYRNFDTITIKNKYSLLLIYKLITKLQGIQYFIKLDIC